MQKPKCFITVRLAMIGLPSVGKSAFCNAALNRPFNQNPLSTTGIQIHRFQHIQHDLKIMYVLYDSNGSESQAKRFNVFDYIRTFEINQDDKITSLMGALIIASKTNPKSIEKIDSYFQYCIGKNNVMPSLVGLFVNKNDVHEEKETVNMGAIYQYATNKNIQFHQGTSKIFGDIRHFFEKFSRKIFTTCLEKKIFVISQPKLQTPKTPGGGKQGQKQKNKETKKR